MTYYAIRYIIKGGEVKAPVIKQGAKEDMERQYYLFCASAATNGDENDVDAIEFGTIEGGKLERKVFDRR